MESRGHSTGSLVGKGDFCTKFSKTGIILKEITHTYYVNRSEYKKGAGTPLRSGTGVRIYTTNILNLVNM
jgi:hypothetical protein